jgi:hypothetical protein
VRRALAARALAIGLGLAVQGAAPAQAQFQGLLGKGEATITITPEALAKLCIWSDKATGNKLVYSSGASQCFNGRNFLCKGNQWSEMKGRFDGPCDADARNAAMALPKTK